MSEVNMDGDEDDCDFDNDFFIRKPKCYHSTPRLSSKIRSVPLTPSVNISPVKEAHIKYFNPFTPDGKVIATKIKAQKKFRRLCLSDLPATMNLDESSSYENLPKSDSESSMEIPSRPRLREMNLSRFNEEFFELEEIGQGVHGIVYKCVNRMNGCIYAVKRTLHPIRTDFQERIVRNEIFAHGILIHKNVVFNFSCWVENGHAYLQNEYCNLGSLEEYRKTNVISENLLWSLLMQMAEALNYIHSKGLAHMDIKPENILMKSDSIEADDSGVGEKSDDITFKLSDFGHITSLDEESDIEEGDCRYLPREILQGNLKYLDKSDIFSLGLTVYEVSGGGPLPKNGDEWQEIRNGKLKSLENLTPEFNSILKVMIHPKPEERPSACNLIKMLKLSQSFSSPTEDDFSYIQQFHHSNTRLQHKVETTGHYLRELFISHMHLQDQLQSGMDSSGYHSTEKLSVSRKRNGGNQTRIVGKKAKRSNSTMF